MKLVVIFFVFLLSALSTRAHDSRKLFDINVAIREADLIFVGQVVDVSYGMSTGNTQDLESLPHTFVTYQIMRLLKGNPKQNQTKLTLRFLGGRGQEASFMYPANFPLFDMNDQDMIFVKGNTVRSCPLVDCAATRMRLITDLVFNERGQEVVLTKRQRVGFAKYFEREEILTHKVSQTVIRAVPSKLTSEGPSESELAIGTPFKVSQFISFVEAKVTALYPPGSFDNSPLVPSADPKQAFTIKPLRAALTKQITPPRRRTPPTNADEQKEAAEYNKRQGNPVIKP